jgi:hypothetical protein
MSTAGLNPLVPAAIPPFTGSGVLPPYIGADATQKAGGSPYETTLSELVVRFGTSPERTSPERRDILRGYLAHRQLLIGFGINGMQWLDGSFVEDVESTQGRPPNDIDIVTFFVRPPALASQTAWDSFWMANERVFNPRQAKVEFKTDPYFVDVSFGPLRVIEYATYFSGLFSHQRVTSLWKGLVKVWLDQQQDDANALQLLGTV